MKIYALTQIAKTEIGDASEQVDLFNEWMKKMTLSGVSFRALISFSSKSEYFSGRDRIDLSEKAKSTNPICRDWISENPLVKASGWKRLFRRAWPEDDNQMQNHFGREEERSADPENSEENATETALKGDFKFHHSFFPGDSVSESVIVPRDQVRGKVTGAIINYEGVRQGKSTTLTFDYWPGIPEPATAKDVLLNLMQAAVNVQKDAIGAKSGLFGKLKLENIHIIPGRNLKVSKAVLQAPLPEDVTLTIDSEPKA